MVDWDYWLGRKYAGLDQSAAADTTRAQAGLISANAGAKLDTVKAGLLPGQTAADIAEANARTRLTNVNATLAPDLASASEAASYGGAKSNVAQAGLYSAQAAGESQSNDILTKALGGDSNVIKALKALHGFGLFSSDQPQTQNRIGLQ